MKLDRSLMDVNCLIRFLHATTQYLPRTKSDHAPLVNLLDGYHVKLGLAPFRFQQM